MRSYCLILAACFLFALNGFADKIDSIRTAIKNSRHDTTLAALYVDLGGVYSETVMDSLIISEKAIKICNEALSRSPGKKIETSLQLTLCKAYVNLGFYNEFKGDNGAALAYFEKAKVIAEKYGDKQSLLFVYNALGYVYDSLGNIPQALQYYHKSLKVSEAIHDIRGSAILYNNIGMVYVFQKSYKKGLEYYNKSMSMYMQVGDSVDIAKVLLNIGSVYFEQLQPDSALFYYNRSLAMRERLGNHFSTAIVLHCIGSVYQNKGYFGKALECYQRALRLEEEAGDKAGVASTLYEFGHLHFQQNEFGKAQSYALRSLELSKETGEPDAIEKAAELLYRIARKTKKFEDALMYHELFITMRDSVANETNRRAAIEEQFRIDFDKKEIAVKAEAKAENDKNMAIAQQEKEKQRFVIYGVAFVLLLALIFGVFMFNRFKVTQKQKVIIEHQKRLVDEKQREVMDSIRYARRIQHSLLPTSRYIQRKLGELMG